MKSKFLFLVFALLLSIIIPISCKNSKEFNKQVLIDTNESKLIFEAIFKGGFSNFANERDSNYYYLVEVHLRNNTDSTCEFITMSCASLVNIVTDSKEINFLYHNCASNYPGPIKLKPNQEFSIPFIVYRKRNNEKFDESVRFGFVLANPCFFHGDRITSQLREMNKEKKHVIWSESIVLSTCSFHPFKISQKINDSTYTEVDDMGIKKRIKK